MKLVMLVAIGLAASCSLGLDITSSDFATTLVSYNGPLGQTPYDDPCAVLGKPTTWIKASSTQTYACSLVFPAFAKSPENNKLVTTIGNDAQIVVGFDHNVADDPCNLYGIDFIVFGNSKFSTYVAVQVDTDMDSYMLTSTAWVNAEPVLVSVAQQPDGPWYDFMDGPYGDDFFPTNAFAWNSTTKSWGQEQDWLKPVNPNLTLGAFNGKSAAQAIALYDGSAGGSGFDLRKLAPADYEALKFDQATGRKYIRYVKFSKRFADEIDDVEVDAVSDVASCGDYRHPRPVGDLNGDCKVDLVDFALLTKDWMTCTWKCQ